MPDLQAPNAAGYRLSGAGIRPGDRVAVLFYDDALDAALREAGAVPMAVDGRSANRLKRSLYESRACGVIVDSEPQRRDVLAVCADLAELEHIWNHADLQAPVEPAAPPTRRWRSALIDTPPVRFFGAILRRRRRRGGGRSETTR